MNTLFGSVSGQRITQDAKLQERRYEENICQTLTNRKAVEYKKANATCNKTVNDDDDQLTCFQRMHGYCCGFPTIY